MDIRTAISTVSDRRDLSADDMRSVMRTIMQGEVTPVQIGGLLIALRMKGETVPEIAAAAAVMREFALHVEIHGEHLVDIVGTGGDSSHTFNISTTAAFVAAAAGARVAKHHARSASSHSGSADVLELAGVRVGLPPERVAQCVDKLGIGFMFAPAHHLAMKHVAAARKELGTRTMFNVLGPLANPARVPNLLLGVFRRELVAQMAEVLKELGTNHALVVHSEDGLDEISISAATHVAELRDNNIDYYDITPEQFGMQRQDRAGITVPDTAASLAMMQSVLDNKPGPARDIVQLNAGAAVYAAGLAPDIQSGVDRAGQAIADGSAKNKLAELIAFTGSLS
jgi:anthranilate phosphoribosyltransferase